MWSDEVSLSVASEVLGAGDDEGEVAEYDLVNCWVKAIEYGGGKVADVECCELYEGG